MKSLIMHSHSNFILNKYGEIFYEGDYIIWPHDTNKKVYNKIIKIDEYGIEFERFFNDYWEGPFTKTTYSHESLALTFIRYNPNIQNI